MEEFSMDRTGFDPFSSCCGTRSRQARTSRAKAPRHQASPQAPEQATTAPIAPVATTRAAAIADNDSQNNAPRTRRHTRASQELTIRDVANLFRRYFHIQNLSPVQAIWRAIGLENQVTRANEDEWMGYLDHFNVRKPRRNSIEFSNNEVGCTITVTVSSSPRVKSRIRIQDRNGTESQPVNNPRSEEIFQEQLRKVEL